MRYKEQAGTTMAITSYRLPYRRSNVERSRLHLLRLREMYVMILRGEYFLHRRCPPRFRQQG